MKVIIIGCGRMGSGLALKLSQNGNNVTIIDTNPKAFEKLNGKFKGRKLIGIGFDRDVLEEAGASMSDAAISCTNSDETNALIGRMLRNIYRVPRVISRLYDPRKAEIYRTLGIQTISTTTWGIQRASELISYDRLDSVLTIGDSDVELVRIELPALLAGRTVNELTVYGEIHVVAISRNNRSFIPISGTVLERNDIVFISFMSGSVRKLRKLLGLS